VRVVPLAEEEVLEELEEAVPELVEVEVITEAKDMMDE